MKSKTPKSERPGCLGQIFSFNMANTEWDSFTKMQKAFGKNYLGLLILAVFVLFLLMLISS
jgi:hypothetical protein